MPISMLHHIGKQPVVVVLASCHQSLFNSKFSLVSVPPDIAISINI